MTNRRKLPNRRSGYNQEFKIEGVSLYLRTGEHEDGSLGEIFVTVRDCSPVLSSMVDAFCIVVSMALQSGVKLEDIVEKFIFTKFEPNGFVERHHHVKLCTSILDAIFRDLAINYLGRTDLSHNEEFHR